MWRNVEALPTHTGKNWAVWRGGRYKSFDDLGLLKKEISGWHPMRPVLIAGPESRHFAPPIFFDQLSSFLINAFRRSTFVGAFFWILFACVTFAGYLHKPSPSSAGFSMLGALGAAMIICDYMGFLRRQEWLAERALFFYWLQSARATKFGFFFWLSFSIAFGGIQVYLQHQLGGFEPLMLAYGTVYAAVFQGEFWRILTGPFFHSSLTHYVSNFSFLCFIGPLTWAIFGFRSVIVFVIGNIVSPTAQTFLHAATHDSYVGVSGGVYALFGFLIGASVLDPKLLPKGFGLYCAWIGAISLIIAEFFSANVASIAHIAGLLFGALNAAIAYRVIPPRKKAPVAR